MFFLVWYIVVVLRFFVGGVGFDRWVGGVFRCFGCEVLSFCFSLVIVLWGDVSIVCRRFVF